MNDAVARASVNTEEKFSLSVDLQLVGDRSRDVRDAVILS